MRMGCGGLKHDSKVCLPNDPQEQADSHRAGSREDARRGREDASPNHLVQDQEDSTRDADLLVIAVAEAYVLLDRGILGIILHAIGNFDHIVPNLACVSLGMFPVQRHLDVDASRRKLVKTFGGSILYVYIYSLLNG